MESNEMAVTILHTLLQAHCLGQTKCSGQSLETTKDED